MKKNEIKTPTELLDLLCHHYGLGDDTERARAIGKTRPTYNRKKTGALSVVIDDLVALAKTSRQNLGEMLIDVFGTEPVTLSETEQKLIASYKTDRNFQRLFTNYQKFRGLSEHSQDVFTTLLKDLFGLFRETGDIIEISVTPGNRKYFEMFLSLPEDCRERVFRLIQFEDKKQNKRKISKK